MALVDRGDFAGATSSASSKLVHGGLRYLQMGDVRLVREAHQERRYLMSVVAPHLVERLPFVFPLYRGGPHRPWVVRTGVLVYSALARAKLNGRVSTKRAVRLVPQLRTEGLHSSAVYADAWTNDGRLTIANVRGAADRDAVVLNYAEVTAIRPRRRRRGGRRADRPGERPQDRQRDGAVARPHPAARGSERGTVGAPEQGRAPGRRRRRGLDAAVTIPHDKVRVSFAIPWEGKLLLGTTDTLHEGEPETGSVTDDDVRTILLEASDAVRDLGQVRASFWGLRVLPGGPGATANARRETVYTTGPTGMLSVAGGKLTTYRRIALDALEQLGVRNLDRAPRPLPGATGLAQIPWPVDLDAGDPHAPAAPVRLARARRARARAARSVAARAARSGPPRPARAGALRARARVGAHGGGRAAPPHDGVALRTRLGGCLRSTNG